MIFITGSTDGIGLRCAGNLFFKGIELVIHARNEHRLSAVKKFIGTGAKVVIGDLSSPKDLVKIAEQVK